MATRSSKRIRIANTGPCYISGLPYSALVHVARYLAAPSRVLFAISMSRGKLHQCEQPSTTANAILSSGVSDNAWECLDFSEIDKILASRLTDDDIKSVLVYIDSKHKLKRLNLCGCINITGVGLEPLRNSVVLDVIDLSLVGQHECPDIQPVPPLSESKVISILNSVIKADGSSLRYVLLPKKFRNNPSKELDIFFTQYNQLLGSRDDTKCSARDENMNRCNQSIVTTGGVATEWIMTSRKKNDIEFYGTQSFTCSKCTNNICDDCNDPRDDNHSYIEHCQKCERDYCLDCSEMLMCARCADYECTQCADMSECERCTRQTCEKCAHGCERCGIELCLGCDSCEDCDMLCCLECRYSRCTIDWRNACRGCLEMVGPHIEAKMEENTRLLAENARLRKDNETP